MTNDNVELKWFPKSEGYTSVEDYEGDVRQAVVDNMPSVEELSLIVKKERIDITIKDGGERIDVIVDWERAVREIHNRLIEGRK